ncbi:MAG TPA: HlyD family efflux transporter periplasmic adaptor subunit [Gemmatimonadaceae bacterium]|nr:HlyD family efflux transporter periplasmic adaptor subunit [Gemmatimonadaceae bacterium]
MNTVKAATSSRGSMDVPRIGRRPTSRYLVGAGVVGGLIVVTVALASRSGSDPVVERASLVIDSVRRGTMVREVLAAGTLVPERVRIIAAVTAGRVEQLPVTPGSAVAPATVLVELSNPDVELERLESERNLNATQAALVEQEGLAQTQRLLQEGSLASLRTQAAEAKRQLKIFEFLDSSRMVARNELAAAREKATELETREDLERRRLGVLISTGERQLTLQRGQVSRLQAISRFQSDRVASMRVRAGETGVLQELPLQLGQWVNPGMLLARIAEPGRLKAVLRVPETQARDVAISQTAAIDTRNGIIRGRVVRIAPASQSGTVEVEVMLEGELPRGARAEQAIDGTIEVERLRDVLYVGRPATSQAESAIELYRLASDGKTAERVRVQLGPVSVNTIQVRRGLNAGDKVIVSDIGAAEGANRVRIR